MDIQDLKLVAAVANAGSYNQAADILGISHQAVSKTMRRIDRETVEPLFTRVSGKVEPTSFGAAFLADAAALTRSFAEFELRYAINPALPSSKQVHQVLSIALVTGGLEGLPDGFFDRYTANNPAVGLSIEEMNSDDVVRSVADGDFDIGILGTHPSLVEAFDVRAIMRMGIWVLVPKTHPWSEVDSIPLASLDRMPIVTAGRRNHLPRFVQDRCLADGIQLNVVATTSNASIMVQQVAERGALCFAFDPRLSEPPAGFHVVKVEFDGADEFGTYAIRRPNAHHSPTAESFWDNELSVIG